MLFLDAILVLLTLYKVPSLKPCMFSCITPCPPRIKGNVNGVHKCTLFLPSLKGRCRVVVGSSKSRRSLVPWNGP